MWMVKLEANDCTPEINNSEIIPGIPGAWGRVDKYLLLFVVVLCLCVYVSCFTNILCGQISIPASAKKTLLRKIVHTGNNISFQSTEPGAGEEFLLLDYRARACAKGVFFHRHRY